VRFAELPGNAIAAEGRTSPNRRVGATKIEINLFDTNAFITPPNCSIRAQRISSSSSYSYAYTMYLHEGKMVQRNYMNNQIERGLWGASPSVSPLAGIVPPRQFFSFLIRCEPI
jgi:hypothetical protein